MLKDKGTERPFTGKFDSFFEDGIYKYKNCDAELLNQTQMDAGVDGQVFEAANKKA